MLFPRFLTDRNDPSAPKPGNYEDRAFRVVVERHHVYVNGYRASLLTEEAKPRMLAQGKPCCALPDVALQSLLDVTALALSRKGVLDAAGGNGTGGVEWSLDLL